MAGKKITVVISQAQGKNPAKRHLEEEIAARLMMESDIDVSIVPHLYDMSADHTGLLFLRSVPGNLVVLSWLYPRGIRWILDRQQVRGHEGLVLLRGDDDDEPDKEELGPKDGTVAEEHPRPNRKIYCIDLKVSEKHDDFINEIRRIADEQSVETVDLMSFIGGQPKGDQLQRYLNPKPVSLNGNGETNGNGQSNGTTTTNGKEKRFELDFEPTGRRWYPVIDYDRCTNCMECIDFCLFGVYGVDKLDTILVEAQDNCKKGCPACSRVCPENAIIFPGHKSSAIAGADGEIAGLKIDLSKLFGGDNNKSALEMAVAERDTELVKDGRDAVGMAVGVPKRQAGKENVPKDDLDDLIDGLDDLGL